MVKVFEAFDSVEPAMMDNLHEEQRVGARAGVCDWSGKPTDAAYRTSTLRRRTAFCERSCPHACR